MEKPHDKENPPKGKGAWKKPVLISVSALAVVLLVAGLALAWMQYAYAQRFYPGVHIGDRAVGGETYLEVLTDLERYAEEIESTGVRFTYADTEITVTPAQLATSDPDLAVSLYSFYIEPSVQQAFSHGRQGTYWQNTLAQVRTFFFGQEIPLQYDITDEALTDLLEDSFKEYDVAAKDAQLHMGADGNLTIVDAEPGVRILYSQAVEGLHQAFRSQEPEIIISVPDEVAMPSYVRADVEPLLSSAASLLDQAPFYLQTPEGKKEINAEQLAPWLIAEPGTVGVVLGLSAERAEEFFSTLAEELDVAPQEGRFAIRDGQVEEIQAGKEGRALDHVATAENMEKAWMSGEPGEAEAVMISSQPLITADAAGPLQGLELLGTGHSNFAGSPNNRRHNIRVGADSVHGVVVMPEEEFSLVNILGPIEKETGYLPELVIKGDKTIPEYGGGLCQIGTTVFRGAMAAALPITERRNHSYSVCYYLENGLPGTDATIYPAHPDLRFVNDMPSPILIQSRIEGNDVYFDFWGKADGRSASRTTPEVWGWVDPPPTKEIVSNELAPGQRKCTERAHKGVKAQFTYTITYPDGEVEEKVFLSTYKPWQEVCLVGPSEA